MTKGAYTKPDRLSDVLALIQVLALDVDTHRSEDGLNVELQGPPLSAAQWIVLAKEHREFFRVSAKADQVSLVARHVLPPDAERKRPTLAPDFTSELLRTAINLHDRQINFAERWKYFVPIWPALITGLLLIVSILVTAWATHPVQTGRFIKVEGLPSLTLLDTATGQLCGMGIGEAAINPNLPHCPALH
jgi:hypothetical protein